jgi:hypothetical protein
VIGAFCSRWVNWSWRTVARDHRRLAALARGPLAHELVSRAETRARDPRVRRQRLAARGRVLMVRVRHMARAPQGVCVVWEQQLAGGEPQSTARWVYLASVARTRDGWFVTRWELQP